jgi:SAM-dependent methyltransferase
LNWRQKAFIQNVVARLPFSNSLYYAIQRRYGSLRPGQHDPTEWLQAAALMMRWARASGRDIAGRSVLEVGTGRWLDVPIAFWLCGARRIVTVDVNPYLSDTLVFESRQKLTENRAQVAALFGDLTATPGFDERLERLAAFSGSLDDLLAMMHVEYMAPADPSRLPVEDRSFDFHVSHVVLQHVPPSALRALLAEARRVLVPSGRLVHLIDLSDMLSHDDPGIPAVHFLRFSEREWRRVAGNRFMHQNRLRPSEYMALFEEAGMRVLDHKKVVDEPSLVLLERGQLPVDARFAGLTLEDLAASHLRVLGTFCERTPLAPEVGQG